MATKYSQTFSGLQQHQVLHIIRMMEVKLVSGMLGDLNHLMCCSITR